MTLTLYASAFPEHARQCCRGRVPAYKRTCVVRCSARPLQPLSAQQSAPTATCRLASDQLQHPFRGLLSFAAALLVLLPACTGVQAQPAPANLERTGQSSTQQNDSKEKQRKVSKATTYMMTNSSFHFHDHKSHGRLQSPGNQSANQCPSFGLKKSN